MSELRASRRGAAAGIELTDRTCIVTGAAQGIGQAEAMLLAACGAAVLCVDQADPGPVVAAIRAAGGTAAPWRGDITRPSAAEAIVDAAASLGPPLAVLVNNAGIVRDRMAFKLTDDDWDAVIAVNLTAPFRLCRAVIRHWRDQPHRAPRRIINTSSESGLYGNAGQSNYAAAKAGLAGLTLTLAAELARRDVCVNAIAPRAHTPMAQNAFDGLTDERLAPRHVASFVAWLASEHADGITGQIMVVAGRQVQVLEGWSARRQAAQPEVATAGSARQLRDELFPHAEGRNVPRPIAELFTRAVVTGGPS